MSKIELAKRLNDIMKAVDYYNYLDNECNVENISNDIVANPSAVISYLIDIIEELI